MMLYRLAFVSFLISVSSLSMASACLGIGVTSSDHPTFSFTCQMKDNITDQDKKKIEAQLKNIGSPESAEAAMAQCNGEAHFVTGDDTPVKCSNTDPKALCNQYYTIDREVDDGTVQALESVLVINQLGLASHLSFSANVGQCSLTVLPTDKFLNPDNHQLYACDALSHKIQPVPGLTCDMYPE